MQKNKSIVGIASGIFVTFTAVWLFLWLKGLQGETNQAELFSATYGVMALFGGLIGLRISKRWGGRKSYIGRAVMFISIGLLAQEFGQISYSMYTYLLQEVIPYPSVGDIGYFSSIIFYALAIYNLIKATSVSASVTSINNKLITVALPLLLLGFSYLQFLKEYEFDFTNPLLIFLDFGYPLGQAFYISLAILAFLLSRKYLGGLMRPVIIFLLIAFLVQYIADFTFLYQVNRDTWVTAGINDYTYLVAYYVMTLALVKFNAVSQKISQKTETNEVLNES